MNKTNAIPATGFPSGRDLFAWRFGLVKEGYRLEPIIAGVASPKIGHATRPLFDPVWRRDRLAALGARISAGQIAKIRFGHGSLPNFFDVFWLLIFDLEVLARSREWDSDTAETERFCA
jgi:hypothetical protein